MRRLPAVIALLIAFTFGLTACGNEESTSSSTGEPTTTQAAESGSQYGGESGGEAGGTPPGVTLSGDVNNKGTEKAAENEIEIDLYDDYFGPTFVEVQPNKEYTVKLHNEGDAFHTFTVESLNVDVPLRPGQKTEVKLTTPANGFAEFICKPHASMGMRGALFIPA